jgi:hypothetical protein
MTRRSSSSISGVLESSRWKQRGMRGAGGPGYLQPEDMAQSRLINVAFGSRRFERAKAPT